MDRDWSMSIKPINFHLLYSARRFNEFGFNESSGFNKSVFYLKYVLLNETFGFNESPGLTNNWVVPEQFVKSSDHCIWISCPKMGPGSTPEIVGHLTALNPWWLILIIGYTKLASLLMSSSLGAEIGTVRIFIRHFQIWPLAHLKPIAGDIVHRWGRLHNFSVEWGLRKTLLVLWGWAYNLVAMVGLAHCLGTKTPP